MQLIKMFILTAMLLMSSQVMAGYWDCDVKFFSQRWDMTAYGDTVTKEIRADRRSAAVSKALHNGFWATKSGFFSSKSIYVCAYGNKKENGKACYYAITDASCRRQ